MVPKLAVLKVKFPDLRGAKGMLSAPGITVLSMFNEHCFYAYLFGLTFRDKLDVHRGHTLSAKIASSPNP